MLRHQPYDPNGDQEGSPYWTDSYWMGPIVPTDDQIRETSARAREMVFLDGICLVCGCPEAIDGYRTHTGQFPALIVECGNHDPRQVCYADDRR